MHAALDSQVPVFLDFCRQRATNSGNRLLMILKCCLMILNCGVYEFEKLVNEFDFLLMA